jgi:hypothetical protein
VHCPLASRPTDPLKYRLTLRDGASTAGGTGKLLRGVVYAGRSDDVIGADRIYGGPGEDEVMGDPFATDPPVGYGGPGSDGLTAPGLMYGGSGADLLQEGIDKKSSDMLVGGPGRDTVWLAHDGRSDVVRIRGGEVDRVDCPSHPDTGDALFVDRSDRLSPSCKNAIVLYTERPRYPYP